MSLSTYDATYKQMSEGALRSRLLGAVRTDYRHDDNNDLCHSQKSVSSFHFCEIRPIVDSTSDNCRNLEN